MDVLNNIDLITTLINKGFTNFEFYVEKITTYIKHQPKTQMIKITGTKMLTIRSGTYDYHNSYFGQIVIKCIDIKKKIRIVSKYEYNIENINKIANLKNRINQLNSKKSILN